MITSLRFTNNILFTFIEPRLKWKDKRFAAGVNRDIIVKGAEMLGVDLGELIDDTIRGMREVAEEIGLKGFL